MSDADTDDIDVAPGPEGPAGPEMTRRAALKTGATAATAAGVAYAGIGGDLPDEIDPIGDAEAIPQAVVGAALLAAGYAGAHALNDLTGSSGDTDEDDLITDQVYNLAESVTTGREPYVEAQQAEMVDPNSNQTTFARNAWQEVRVATVKAHQNDKSKSEAQTQAQEALDKAATIAAYNELAKARSMYQSLIKPFVLAINNQTMSGNQIYADSTSGAPSAQESWLAWMEPVESSGVENGGYLVHKGRSEHLDGVETGIRLPTPVSKIDQIDDNDPPELWAVDYGGGLYFKAGDWIPGNTAENSMHNIMVDHPDWQRIKAWDHSVIQQTLEHIYNKHDEITQDISTYVDSIYAGIEQGTIEPADILSGTDIMDEMASSGEVPRFVASMLASGQHVPSNAGMQVEIAHPDLVADSLWGYLFPRFEVDSPPKIEPGATIPATDYSVAYFGYTSKDDGSLNQEVLSSSSGDIQILDVTDIDGTKEVDPSKVDDASASDTGLIIWRGSDPPDPIGVPSNHQNWSITVEGASNTSTHSPSEIETSTEDGETIYELPSTDLNAGEQVEDVRLIPSADYSQPMEPVADPANVDTEQTIQQLEDMQERFDSIEEQLESGGGLGLAGDLPALPDWIPGDGVAQYAVAGGGVLGGLKGLDLAFGR